MTAQPASLNLTMPWWICKSPRFLHSRISTRKMVFLRCSIETGSDVSFLLPRKSHCLIFFKAVFGISGRLEIFLHPLMLRISKEGISKTASIIFSPDVKPVHLLMFKRNKFLSSFSVMGSSWSPTHLLKPKSRNDTQLPRLEGRKPSALHSLKFNSVMFCKLPIDSGNSFRNLHFVKSNSRSWLQLPRDIGRVFKALHPLVTFAPNFSVVKRQSCPIESGSRSSIWQSESIKVCSDVQSPILSGRVFSAMQRLQLSRRNFFNRPISSGKARRQLDFDKSNSLKCFRSHKTEGKEFKLSWSTSPPISMLVICLLPGSTTLIPCQSLVSPEENQLLLWGAVGSRNLSDVSAWNRLRKVSSSGPKL